jgi:phosphoglycolate phosphatase-like HAD superfamily hydrolase
MVPDMDKYHYFFFDFDGVIVDSLGIKAEAFGSLFEGYGQEVVDKVIDYHLTNGGVSRYEKFKYYYANLIHEEITPEIMDELDRLYSSRVVEKVVAAAEIDGVVDFMRERNSEGKLCFVVSATPQEEIRRITRLKGIDRIFKEVVGSPKKKSQNLGYLLEKYSIERDEAVFFGDAKSDYEAALENGVDFVGVADEKNRELAAIDGITRIKDFRQFGV